MYENDADNPGLGHVYIVVNDLRNIASGDVYEVRLLSICPEGISTIDAAEWLGEHGD